MGSWSLGPLEVLHVATVFRRHPVPGGQVSQSTGCEDCVGSVWTSPDGRLWPAVARLLGSHVGEWWLNLGVVLLSEVRGSGSGTLVARHSWCNTAIKRHAYADPASTSARSSARAGTQAGSTQGTLAKWNLQTWAFARPGSSSPEARRAIPCSRGSPGPPWS